MKVYFDRKVLLGFVLALGTLTVLGIYSYKKSQDSINTSRMVSHTKAVLYRIEKFHSLNLEIEAELMRHVTPGDSTFPSFFGRSNKSQPHLIVSCPEGKIWSEVTVTKVQRFPFSYLRKT